MFIITTRYLLFLFMITVRKSFAENKKLFSSRALHLLFDRISYSQLFMPGLSKNFIFSKILHLLSCKNKSLSYERLIHQ